MSDLYRALTTLQLKQIAARYERPLDPDHECIPSAVIALLITRTTRKDTTS
jgi:hypothetical protein